MVQCQVARAYWKLPALNPSLHFSFVGVSLWKASLGTLLKAYALKPGLTHYVNIAAFCIGS